MDDTLRDLVGACLFLGIDEVEPGASLDGFLADLRPGGIILFSRNIRDAEQVRRLGEAVRTGADPPRLVGVDQEGGRVERLRPILGPLPAPAELAREGEGATEELGRLLADALWDLGFNLNFAPVLDLSRPGAPNGIGDRAFGDQPATVGRLGRAYLRGLGAGGVLGVAKHFPGLGPTAIDSHRALPRADKDPAAFRREDLLPFREVANLAPAIMMGHAHYPFLEERAIPASCSRAVATDLLRGELGFDGAAIADDLEMEALDQGPGWLEASASALRAGCDMVLVCRDRRRMIQFRDYLVDRVRDGSFPAARLEEAAGRAATLRRAAARGAASAGLAQSRAKLRRRFGRGEPA